MDLTDCQCTEVLLGAVHHQEKGKRQRSRTKALPGTGTGLLPRAAKCSGLHTAGRGAQTLKCGTTMTHCAQPPRQGRKAAGWCRWDTSSTIPPCYRLPVPPLPGDLLSGSTRAQTFTQQMLDFLCMETPCTSSVGNLSSSWLQREESETHISLVFVLYS